MRKVIYNCMLFIYRLVTFYKGWIASKLVKLKACNVSQRGGNINTLMGEEGGIFHEVKENEKYGKIKIYRIAYFLFTYQLGFLRAKLHVNKQN